MFKIIRLKMYTRYISEEDETNSENQNVSETQLKLNSELK
jgi:hypothetical protein